MYIHVIFKYGYKYKVHVVIHVAIQNPVNSYPVYGFSNTEDIGGRDICRSPVR